MKKKSDNYKGFLKSFLFIILGILSAAFGLESFLISNHLIDGGVTGSSMLLSKLTSINLSVFLILFNLPFIFMAHKHIGRVFALKTTIAIIALALLLAFGHDFFPHMTNEKILAAVFGGFFIGAGIGLTIRGGAVLDGTEVFAVYLSRRIGFSVSDIIMLINITIFLIASIELPIDSVLYSILAYLIAGRTIDFIIDGIEEYTSVTIITKYPTQMREMITKKLGWGITIYHGKSGYDMKELEILCTIVTRLEISKLTQEIEIIDPKAFLITQSIKDTHGGMVKKKPLH